MAITDFPFCVLNPGGRDPDQDFPDFAGPPQAQGHAPVNYHGYAACVGGSFLRSVEAVASRHLRHVLLLLRSDLPAALRVLVQLQARGCRVFISFKESGLHQITQTLEKKGNAAAFHALCTTADGALASTSDAAALYTAAGACRVEFIATPYPVDDPRWDFSRPIAERRGIFVGTREWDVPTRQHLTAVLTALHLSAESSQPVSVVNLDGRTGRRRLEDLAASVPGAELHIIEGRRNYPDYLRLIAGHRLVWQCDTSSVPGQVAGDAALCRLPCLGGNGATERLAFPEFTGHGHSLPELADLARALLDDTPHYAETVARLAETTRRLSFGGGATRLVQTFGPPAGS